MSKAVLTIFFVIIATLTAFICLEELHIRRLQEASETQQEDVRKQTESLYVGKIKASEIRYSDLKKQFDSLEVVKVSIKSTVVRNNKKTDEKIKYIINANDSVLYRITDSILRANGFNR